MGVASGIQLNTGHYRDKTIPGGTGPAGFEPNTQVPITSFGPETLHNCVSRSQTKQLKHCADVDHFHMITWHHNHPTCEHSYVQMKKLQGERQINPYQISCQKIYNPYGLCSYLTMDPAKRSVTAAGHLETPGQLSVYRRICDKPLQKTEEPMLRQASREKSTSSYWTSCGTATAPTWSCCTARSLQTLSFVRRGNTFSQTRKTFNP